MKINHCRGCGAKIVFLTCEKGFMPVNAGTVTEGDEVYEHGKHVSHFATCEKAAGFRRKQHTDKPQDTPRRIGTADMLADPIGAVRQKLKDEK